MKNEKVIENFVNRNNNKDISSHTQNLYTNYDGTKLMNYSTCLAQFDHDNMVLYVNSSKYSVTTSKIQNMLKRELQYLHYYKIEYVQGSYAQKDLK